MYENQTKPHNASSLKHADVAVGELVTAPEAFAAARLQQRLAVLEEGGEEVGEEVRDEAVLLLVTLRPEHGNPLCKMTLPSYSLWVAQEDLTLLCSSCHKICIFEGEI